MREHELRQLKKQTADFEEQNAVLSKHIDSIKSAIGKTDHYYYFPQKFSTMTSYLCVKSKVFIYLINKGLKLRCFCLRTSV
jgi:hypothetical protein